MQPRNGSRYPCGQRASSRRGASFGHGLGVAVKAWTRGEFSSANIFLSEDAFLVSRAYLTRAEVVRKAASITPTRLAVKLSGSMLETLSLELLQFPMLLMKESGITKHQD